MMHTVLLVYPGIGFHYQKYSGRTYVPGGVLLVGTALCHAGYRVKIIDQNIEEWKLKLTEALKEQIICLGISSMTGTQILNGLEIAGFFRTLSTAPIVWGGVHPTLLPEQTLENELVDIIVRREGEEVMVELMDAFKYNEPLAEIRGISYKEDGKIFHNPDQEFVDLNKQPLPYWELINLQDYNLTKTDDKFINIATSRGCPFNCGYCYVNVFHKRRWRTLSIDNVLKRMTFLRNEHGINHFRFDDEEFFIDLARSRELLRHFKKLDIRWETSVRIDSILRMDDDFLILMEESGCIKLEVGVESGSNKLLKLMKKKITRDDTIEANRKLARYNLNIMFLFMIGFPTETLEDMKETVSLALQLKRENKRARVSHFSMFTPFPGCELHDLAIQYGLKQPDCLEKWATFHQAADNAVWLSEDIRKTARMLSFTSAFLNNPVDSYPPFYIRFLGIIYRYIARQRINYFFFRFPVEISLAKWFNLYY